jgi:hypothetical protein
MTQCTISTGVKEEVVITKDFGKGYEDQESIEACRAALASILGLDVSITVSVRDEKSNAG